MPLYLLDTNSISDVLRRPEGSAAGVLFALQSQIESVVATSVIVAAEVRFGFEKQDSKYLRRRFEEMLVSLPILSLNIDVDQTYAHLRNRLERHGKLIGENDMLIAAHALTLDAILVTDNTRESGACLN